MGKGPHPDGAPDGSRLGPYLAAVRRRRPLIHHITNAVVTNVTANATLAIGASPVMAVAPEEVNEVAAAAGALVLNIGTLTVPGVDVMIAAGREANRQAVPVILDPVGFGFTTLRTESTRRILADLELAVIRGNQAEIALLAGGQGTIRGVDAAGAGSDQWPLDALTVSLARRTGAVVAMTGPVDRISDGERLALVANGHPMLTQVTGTGCMATAVVAAFVAASPDRRFEATVAALCFYGLAAERAARSSRGPGGFQSALLDQLYLLQPEDLREGARTEIVTPDRAGAFGPFDLREGTDRQ